MSAGPKGRRRRWKSPLKKASRKNFGRPRAGHSTAVKTYQLEDAPAWVQRAEQRRCERNR